METCEMQAVLMYLKYVGHFAPVEHVYKWMI